MNSPRHQGEQRRAAILGAVHGAPGIALRTLARHLNMDHTVARYYVKRLENRGALKVFKGKPWRIFAYNSLAQDEHLARLLTSAQLQRLHAWICTRPATGREHVLVHAHRSWGWPHTSTHDRLKRLELARAIAKQLSLTGRTLYVCRPCGLPGQLLAQGPGLLRRA